MVYLLLIASLFISTHSEASTNEGKRLSFERSQGNCLACHSIAEGEFAGNIGPPLTALASRFRSKQQLYQQIWDATQFNPETSMPPFGKNKILSSSEIDRIVNYLWSLP